MPKIHRRSFLQTLIATAGLANARGAETPSTAKADWLINATSFPARIVNPNKRELSLTNGLVSRTFRLAPNAATVAFDDLINGESLQRSVRP